MSICMLTVICSFYEQHICVTYRKKDMGLITCHCSFYCKSKFTFTHISILLAVYPGPSVKSVIDTVDENEVHRDIKKSSWLLEKLNEIYGALLQKKSNRQLPT